MGEHALITEDAGVFAEGAARAVAESLIARKVVGLILIVVALAEKPLPQIGRELNVDAVVEGDVQQAGDLVRVDILVGGEPVDALSCIVHRDRAYEWGRELASRLKVHGLVELNAQVVLAHPRVTGQ